MANEKPAEALNSPRDNLWGSGVFQAICIVLLVAFGGLLLILEGIFGDKVF